MKQKMLFMTVAMLMVMAGTMTTACSSDDDVVTPKEQNAEQVATKGSEAQLPDVGEFIKVISDTGYMRYNAFEGCWFIDTPLPTSGDYIPIDGGICYYVYNLPEEFKTSGLMVKFTGDAYECKELDKNGDGLENIIGGEIYYDVVIKDIQLAE